MTGTSAAQTASPYRLRGEKLKPLTSCTTWAVTAPEGEERTEMLLPQPVVLAVCGSFNPIHNAHVKLYNVAKETIDGREDEYGRTVVLGGFVSPVSDAYGKPGLVRAPERLRLIEEVLRGHPDLNADAWECQQPVYIRTCLVLQHLKESVNAWYSVTEPEAMAWCTSQGRSVKVVLVCGADLFSSFWIPGCWPLCLLKQLLDSFPLVVVHREGSHQVVKNADDFRAMCKTRPALTETTDAGETITLDLTRYTFTFAQFPDSDETSSTSVRELARRLAETPSHCIGERTALEAELGRMLPSSVIPRVVELYGSSSAIP